MVFFWFFFQDLLSAMYTHAHQLPVQVQHIIVYEAGYGDAVLQRLSLRSR